MVVLAGELINQRLSSSWLVQPNGFESTMCRATKPSARGERIDGAATPTTRPVMQIACSLAHRCHPCDWAKYGSASSTSSSGSPEDKGPIPMADRVGWKSFRDRPHAIVRSHR